jgi:hypothetical protein
VESVNSQFATSNNEYSLYSFVRFLYRLALSEVYDTLPDKPKIVAHSGSEEYYDNVFTMPLDEDLSPTARLYLLRNNRSLISYNRQVFQFIIQQNYSEDSYIRITKNGFDIGLGPRHLFDIVPYDYADISSITVKEAHIIYNINERARLAKKIQSQNKKIVAHSSSQSQHQFNIRKYLYGCLVKLVAFLFKLYILFYIDKDDSFYLHTVEIFELLVSFQSLVGTEITINSDDFSDENSNISSELDYSICEKSFVDNFLNSNTYNNRGWLSPKFIEINDTKHCISVVPSVTELEAQQAGYKEIKKRYPQLSLMCHEIHIGPTKPDFIFRDDKGLLWVFECKQKPTGLEAQVKSSATKIKEIFNLSKIRGVTYASNTSVLSVFDL